MTTQESAEPRSVELELRMPRAVLALDAVVVAVVVGVFVSQGSFDGSPVFIAFFALVLVISTATLLSRARAYADGTLEVRNRFRTRTLQRNDIDRVMLGQQGGLGSARRLELLLTDGDVLPLVGTERAPLPGARQRLEQQGEQLRAWVAGTALPHR